MKRIRVAFECAMQWSALVCAAVLLLPPGACECRLAHSLHVQGNDSQLSGHDDVAPCPFCTTASTESHDNDDNHQDSPVPAKKCCCDSKLQATLLVKTTVKTKIQPDCLIAFIADFSSESCHDSRATLPGIWDPAERRPGLPLYLALGRLLI